MSTLLFVAGCALAFGVGFLCCRRWRYKIEHAYRVARHKLMQRLIEK